MAKERLIDPEPGVLMAPHYEEEVARLVKDPVVVGMVDDLPPGATLDRPTRWDFTMAANQVYAQRCANAHRKPINESIGGVRWAIIALFKQREEARHAKGKK